MLKYSNRGVLMNFMLCNLWTDFSYWVTETWSDAVYIIIVCFLGICGLLGVLSFFKQSINKDTKPKWGILIVAIIMFVLLAVLFFARYA